MATLELLKYSLRQKAETLPSELKQPLSDLDYAAGFQSFKEGPGQVAYTDFVVHQVSRLIEDLLKSRPHISVLEIGPGAESVLGSLPDRLRRSVHRYVAFEPNDLFATRLKKRLKSEMGAGTQLPCLEGQPVIHRVVYMLGSNPIAEDPSKTSRSFDVVLFCHSMYGMHSKQAIIQQAIEMLPERARGEMVIVFHREGNLRLDGMACHQTACYPTGLVRVDDVDDALDRFSTFIAGFKMLHSGAVTIKAQWRELCRSLGRRDLDHPSQLTFSSPDIMVAFTRHASSLSELSARVPVLAGDKRVKNQKARLNHPTAIVRPTNVQQIQHCVDWALQNESSLTVIGGGHSGHCLYPNVVAVDMSAFDKIHVIRADKGVLKAQCKSLVVVEAGCKSGDVIQKALTAGLTVPMGARPSVGAGLWLQGGIGHLARTHGLTCDAIVGAVMVSVADGQLLYAGDVPHQHRPAGAVRAENEKDLLWAIKGGGTNFGIVVSLTFKASRAPLYRLRNGFFPLNDLQAACINLSTLQNVAETLSRTSSVDAYLYWEDNQLRLGVTTYESSTSVMTEEDPALAPFTGRSLLGSLGPSETVDSVGLFETEMYMSAMHGGHGAGKTSSFKRCLFLKNIGATELVDVLVAAIKKRPTSWCYLHLLHGGGAIGDVAKEATAFGCRDWDFACVLTGVWPRDQDDTDIARAAVKWVYDVAMELLPLSRGVYGADLGPDPRDAALADVAFGPNLPRLGRLKSSLDPGHVLPYACPLPRRKTLRKLVILVTGDHGAGKDYCANVWVNMLSVFDRRSLCARSASISTATKREYAAASGADLQLLETNRAYKEQHRSALSEFFQGQVLHHPNLPQEHFLDVVRRAGDFDVLFITGLRDEAPVAALSHLLSDTKLIEVRIQVDSITKATRRDYPHTEQYTDDCKSDAHHKKAKRKQPDFVFNNDMYGSKSAADFCMRDLLPLMYGDLQQLREMVRTVPNFPSQGIDFRDVLGVSQQPGGLALCTTLLDAQLKNDWSRIDAIACCETGGFIYASALAAKRNIPMALIRAQGKLPPPTISVAKPTSYISSSAAVGAGESRIEMGQDVIPRNASVVVVDDVLASGKTLCAVLHLLKAAGVDAENVSVLVVAEFPFHRGRDLLCQQGFGKARIQSLLVLDGA